MKKFFRYAEIVVLGGLVVVCVTVWSGVHALERGVLTVAFLDVGQGDAIFIESPVGNQVLIDAGFGSQILRKLSEVMPLHDRSIDVILATHADADHVGGFPDVLGRFQVAAVLEGGSVSESGIYETFHEFLANEGARHALIPRGSVVNLGGGAYLHILFPDREASAWDDNTASVVAKLVYGETSFLLTGDAPDEIEEYLLSLDGEYLKSNVLKAGHHGSRTSSDRFFVATVDPDYTVISAGCDNSHGHPHQEVLDVLVGVGTQILSTCEDGTVVFESDGKEVSLTSN